MCSAISKSSPSNCHPKSREVRYKWAVLDMGRNSVRPWTMARTITCNRGIRSRFPESRVLCQVRGQQGEAFLENRRGAGNLALGSPLGTPFRRLLGHERAFVAGRRPAESGPEGTRSQDWLPHKAAHLSSFV